MVQLTNTFEEIFDKCSHGTMLLESGAPMRVEIHGMHCTRSDADAAVNPGIQDQTQ